MRPHFRSLNGMITVRIEQIKPKLTNTLTLSFHIPLSCETLMQTLIISRKTWLSLQSNLSMSPKRRIYKTSYSKRCIFNIGMMEGHTDTCKNIKLLTPLQVWVRTYPGFVGNIRWPGPFFFFFRALLHSEDPGAQTSHR